MGRRTMHAFCWMLLSLACVAAGKQQQQRAAVVDGLPEVIPLKLLLGNSKYRNPQVRGDHSSRAPR
jgi:hypothetical protein